MDNLKYKVSAIVSCYKGQKYLAAFLESVAAQTIKNQIEIVLVHNDPAPEELEIVKKFQNEHYGLFNHIVVPREKLAVSTNRAMKAASGKYLCVWNVDDLRTPNSLELMTKTLDENPDIGFTYGDYIIVNKWLSQEGKLVVNPEFQKKEFIQSMHTGPFYMWRKSLCAKIGYWDEQCLQGADYDFSSRLASESEGKKTSGFLGYYLDEGLGMSTNRATLQPIEAVFIQLRFGVYNKLDFWYYKRAKRYNIHNILDGGKWLSMDELAPHWREYAESKWWLVYAVVRYPFLMVKRTYKHFIKN